MSEKNEIIPFGKYKGCDIAEMIADREYIEWLQAQSWFSEKYSKINQIIINYGVEPEETPEHNAMQAQFLRRDLLLAVLKRLNPSFYDKISLTLEIYDFESLKNGCQRYLHKPVTVDIEQIECDLHFEVMGFDLFLNANYELKITDEDGNLYIGRVIASCDYDKSHNYQQDGNGKGYAIELKPTLSDDYPAVLRQIKRNLKCCAEHARPRPVLIVGLYHGKGATWAEVVQIFGLSGIKAILMAEIEVNLPSGAVI
jgi:uncharacterized protein (DUF3820 family)